MVIIFFLLIGLLFYFNQPTPSEIYEKALASKNIDLCKKIPIYDDQDIFNELFLDCYYDLSVLFKNPSLCKEMDNDSHSNIRDLEYICIYRYIHHHGDYTLCNLVDEGDKIRCFSNFKFIFDNDLSFCDKVNETSKNNCIFSILEWSNNYESCDLITDEKMNQDCFYSIGVRQNINSSCNRIESDLKMRDDCYLKNSDTYNSIYLCLNITDDKLRNRCFTYRVHKDNDVSYCNLTHNPQIVVTYEECIIQIAYDWNKPDYCSYIDKSAHSADRDLCFSRVAVRKYNDTICDKISSEDSKLNCKIDTNRAIFGRCKAKHMHREDCPVNMSYIGQSYDYVPSND